VSRLEPNTWNPSQQFGRKKKGNRRKKASAPGERATETKMEASVVKKSRQKGFLGEGVNNRLYLAGGKGKKGQTCRTLGGEEKITEGVHSTGMNQGKRRREEGAIETNWEKKRGIGRQEEPQNRA